MPVLSRVIGVPQVVPLAFVALIGTSHCPAVFGVPLIRPVSDADPEACDGSSAKLPLALKVWIWKPEPVVTEPPVAMGVLLL